MSVFSHPAPRASAESTRSPRPRVFTVTSAAGREVALLEREGQDWFGQGKRLVLDLREVRFIDPDGLALLERWAGPALVLQGGSPFVRLLLRRQGLL